MKYLLDTCLLSELVKPQPKSSVLRWMSEQTDTALYMSAMTLADLERGVERLPSSRRKTELSIWVHQLERGFGKRILPFTQQTAHYWAAMCAKTQSAGKTMAAFDSIIAATALEHGLVLITRNVADFAQAPIVLINPWAE